jgi:hypothetical protein
MNIRLLLRTKERKDYMSFVEWYEDTYGNQWHEDYASLGSSIEWLEEYRKYCDQNNIKPIWNG